LQSIASRHLSPIFRPHAPARTHTAKVRTRFVFRITGRFYPEEAALPKPQSRFVPGQGLIRAAPGAAGPDEEARPNPPGGENTNEIDEFHVTRRTDPDPGPVTVT
jgi:hypothetical protein